MAVATVWRMHEVSEWGAAGGEDGLRDRARGALAGLVIGDLVGPTRGSGTDRSRQVMSLAVALQGDAADLSVEHRAARWARAADDRLAAVPDGAVTRAVVVGIARRSDPFADVVELAVAAGAGPHDNRLAHAAAAAVACAVAAAVDGLAQDQILPLALSAAGAAATSGARRPGPDVAARIAWACGLARGAADPAAVIELLVGTSEAPQESVPAAFAIAATYDDPWVACRAAADLGGSGAIAPLAGALVGARTGLAAFPAEAVDVLAAGPGVDVSGVADGLLELRGSRA